MNQLSALRNKMSNLNHVSYGDVKFESWGSNFLLECKRQKIIYWFKCIWTVDLKKTYNKSGLTCHLPMKAAVVWIKTCSKKKKKKWILCYTLCKLKYTGNIKRSGHPRKTSYVDDSMRPSLIKKYSFTTSSQVKNTHQEVAVMLV